VQKLSSGRQINSAKDNAAGLGISEGVASIRNISDQSIRNLQSATSLVQTADGALDVVGKMLQRVLTLTTQKTDAVLNAAQTASIDTEITALTNEITRIKNRTTYNDTASVFGRTYTFGSGAGVTTEIVIPDMTSVSLGLQPQAIRAEPVTSNVGTNTFTFNLHGYSNNDQLVYYKGDGDPVGGLISGSTYYVVNKTDNTFQLSSSRGGSVSPLTGAGTIADDFFQKIYTINEVGFNTASSDTLVMTSNLNWSVGRYVLFNAGANTSIVPLNPVAPTLEDDRAYQIKSNDGISVQLNSITNPATTITYSPSTNLTDATLGLLAVSVDTNTTLTANAFNLSDDSIVNGTQLVLSSPSAGGLTQWRTYYARDVGGGEFKIAATLTGDALTISDTESDYEFRRVGADVANFTVPNMNVNVVVSGGFDARVKFWTWNGPGQLNLAQEIYVAMPIQHMSCAWPLLVTAHQ
jgi:flagellin-like hook-associated protein FlgL